MTIHKIYPLEKSQLRIMSGFIIIIFLLAVIIQFIAGISSLTS